MPFLRIRFSPGKNIYYSVQHLVGKSLAVVAVFSMLNLIAQGFKSCQNVD